MRLKYATPARIELREAAEFYASRKTGLGEVFIEAVDRTVSRILGDPLSLPIVLDDIRRARVHRFPYDVYFRVKGEIVEILVVKHDARDSSFWLDRL